jgi:hypothetical protein
MTRRRRMSREDFLNMSGRLSKEDFRKLMDILMQEGPRIKYKNPEKWRNY